MSMSNTENTVKEIRRNTRRKFSTEEKIRIVLDGLRGSARSARHDAQGAGLAHHGYPRLQSRLIQSLCGCSDVACGGYFLYPRHHCAQTITAGGG